MAGAARVPQQVPVEPGARRATRVVAWSIGRRQFQFEAALGAAAPLGSHVVVAAPDGRRFLGQVIDADVVSAAAGRSVHGGGTLIARLDAGGPAPVGLGEAFDDAQLEPAPPAALEAWQASALGDGAVLEIGHAQGDETSAVRLAAAGFARHTFLCGQSGSGKTYTLGLLLERLLLETELRLVVLDPNSDYVRLAELEPPPGAGIPPARLRDLTARIGVFRPGDEGLRLKIRFGRFPFAMQALVLDLDPLRDAEEYDALRRLTDGMGGTEYSLTDLRERLADASDPALRRLRLRMDNLGVARWGIWAERDDVPLLEQAPKGWRAAVIDLGRVATAQERSTVAAATLAELWNGRHARRPVLVVIDEAHNVCPQEPADHTQALAVDLAIAIAAEGRKYGLYLLLATQRPQKLHVNVLSQCENLILMRVGSAADLEHLATTFSQVPRSLIGLASGFGLGEGLVAGRISPSPVLFRSGQRLSPQGGEDVPTTWAASAG